MPVLKEFPICIYGEITQYNEVLSKARCRIFYKYKNRNGTYITDEFAEKLLSSLSYVPIKGIYDIESGDFTDHGRERNEGRIYGFVPAEPNVAWELHLDEDGVEREYACVDVMLFTALYAEAKDIVGKAQSMEIYEPSIKYHMAVYDGQKYVVFDEGCFLGLQVLGDKVEPCFEGASFFALQKTIEDTIEKIKEFSKGGQSEMPTMNFKLSDDQKYSALWTLLNPEYTEEGNWTCSYSICEVFDDYALVRNYATGSYERAYYTKDDAANCVEITKSEPVYVLDITESEKVTLDTLRKLNGDTYELVSENLTNAEQNATEVAEYSVKIEELNTTISTLNTEAESAAQELANANTNYSNAQATIGTLNEEVDSLRNYKLSIETQQKEAVIAEYADKLAEEVLDTYKAKINEYTVRDLDKELAYELKQTNVAAFAPTTYGYFPKDQNVGGIEEILSRYKK